MVVAWLLPASNEFFLNRTCLVTTADNNYSSTPRGNGMYVVSGIVLDVSWTLVNFSGHSIRKWKEVSYNYVTICTVVVYGYVYVCTKRYYRSIDWHTKEGEEIQHIADGVMETEQKEICAINCNCTSVYTNIGAGYASFIL